MPRKGGGRRRERQSRIALGVRLILSSSLLTELPSQFIVFVYFISMTNVRQEYDADEHTIQPQYLKVQISQNSYNKAHALIQHSHSSSYSRSPKKFFFWSVFGFYEIPSCIWQLEFLKIIANLLIKIGKGAITMEKPGRPI